MECELDYIYMVSPVTSPIIYTQACMRHQHHTAARTEQMQLEYDGAYSLIQAAQKQANLWR